MAHLFAALVQFVTVLARGRVNERVRAFQARKLDLHARTFGFLLSLTDVPPWRQPHPIAEAAPTA